MCRAGALSRLPWRARVPLLALAVAALSLVAIAYFVNAAPAARYADDWVYEFFGSGVARTTWTPQTAGVEYRVLSIWLAPILAHLRPALEPLLYLARLALHFANVALLGLLAFRLSGSPRTGLLTAALYLVPLFAYEPLLWFSASVFYLVPLFLFLAGAHLLLSVRDGHARRRAAFLMFLSLAAWFAMLLFIESGLLLPLIVPVMALVLARRGQRVSLRPILVVVVLFYLGASWYVVSALRDSPIVAVHGESTLDPVLIVTERIPQVTGIVLGYFAEWLPRGLWADALELGLRTLAPLSLVLVAALAVSSLALAVSQALRGPALALPSESRLAGAFSVIAVGLAWFVFSLVPVLFIRDLSVSSRVMLFPSAGLALAGAGALGTLLTRLPRITRPVLLVLVAGFLLANALSMSGLAAVHRLRWERDAAQLSAFRSALPTLPAERVYILPHALEQATVSPLLGRPTQLDTLLYGLFDIPWAAAPALDLAYSTERIELAPRDALRQFHITDIQRDGQGRPTGLVFQADGSAQAIPISGLLAFTHRGGRFYWLDPLILHVGTTAETISLPMAAPLTGAPHRSADLPLEPAR